MHWLLDNLGRLCHQRPPAARGKLLNAGLASRLISVRVCGRFPWNRPSDWRTWSSPAASRFFSDRPRRNAMSIAFLKARKTMSSQLALMSSISLCVQTLASTKSSRKVDQRIDLLPGFHFGLFAIAAGIGGRVAAETIGQRIQQHRPVAVFQDRLLAGDGINHRQRVVAVDALGVHLLGIQPAAKRARILKPMVSPTGWPPMP